MFSEAPPCILGVLQKMIFEFLVESIRLLLVWTVYCFLLISIISAWQQWMNALNTHRCTKQIIALNKSSFHLELVLKALRFFSWGNLISSLRARLSHPNRTFISNKKYISCFPSLYRKAITVWSKISLSLGSLLAHCSFRPCKF